MKLIQISTTVHLGNSPLSTIKAIAWVDNPVNQGKRHT